MTNYQPISSAARQAWIDGYPEDELRQIDAEQADYCPDCEGRRHNDGTNICPVCGCDQMRVPS